MFFNEQGMLNLDEAVMNQPTFKKIMEDGIVTEQEIKEQSERIVSILKSMEKNYTEEQQREIRASIYNRLLLNILQLISQKYGRNF